MIRHREASEVRLFDYFKLAVLIILVVLMFVFGDSGDEQLVEEETAVGQIEVTATPTPTPTPTTGAPNLVDLFGGGGSDDDDEEEVEATPTPMPEDGTSSLSTLLILPDEATGLSGDDTLSGTGIAGTRVDIINEEDEVIGSVIVAEDGTWEIEPDLPAGTYLLRLRTYSADDTLLESSDEIEVIIQDSDETTGPSALPRFVDLPDIVQSGFVTLNGEAEPNELVTLTLNERTVSTVQADEAGNFSFPLYLSGDDAVLGLTSGIQNTITPLAVAERQITEIVWQLSRLDDNAWQAEGETMPSGTIYLLGGDDVPVIADENGRYTIPLPTSANAQQYDTYQLQTWQAGNLVAQSHPIQAHSFANHFFAWDTQMYEDGILRLFGIGETPNSTLTLYQNGEFLGEVVTNANGRWSFTAPVLENDQEAVITTERTLPDSSTSEYTAPLTVSSIRAQPNMEQFQWLPLVDEAVGSTRLEGEGIPGTIVQFWANGLLLGETQVLPDGNWSLPITLATDSTEFAFRVLDVNGRLYLEINPDSLS